MQNPHNLIIVLRVKTNLRPKRSFYRLFLPLVMLVYVVSVHPPSAAGHIF